MAVAQRHAVRPVGVLCADESGAASFVEAAIGRGLTTHRSGPAAVAWDPATTPPVSVATAADGSFVVVDGELFGGTTADDVLERLRRSGAEGLSPVRLEALVAHWDAPARRLRVLRDQSGVVPGLVATAGEATVWSSEHDGLLVAGVAPVHDPVALDELLAVGWVTPPRSYLRDARTITAGHLAEAAPGRPAELRPWWRHRATPTSEGSFDEQVAELGDVLTTAIADRADARHLGAFLSAGVDSTVIVAVVRRLLDRPIDTFTFRYLAYEGQMNEDEFAAGTAKVLGAPHHVIEVAPDDLRSRFADIVARYQSPFTYGVHSFKQDLVTELGVDVVLSGSDPGFWQHYGTTGAVAARLARVPAAQRRALLELARRVRTRPVVSKAWWAGIIASHGTMSEVTPWPLRRELLGADVATAGARAMATDVAAGMRLHGDEPPGRRPVFVFEQLLVPEYVGQWNHRWGRTFGTPIRQPLWDPDVVRVADRRRDLRPDKPLLRRFAETLVPHERANAPKIFQEVPLGHWFRGPLRDLVEDGLAPDRLAAAGVAPDAVRRLIDGHVDASRPATWTLWGLLTAVEWVIGLRERPPTPLLVR